MSTFKLAILTIALLAFGASACLTECHANYYFKSSDNTCAACDSTAIAGTVDTTNTYVSCSADTATSKMVLLKQNGAEAAVHTGCAAGYFYTTMVTTSGSEAAGKCESCHATAMTGVANKAATTHVSCTANTAATKLLAVTATGQEAAVHTGCAAGYFYTPKVTTSGSEAAGKCEACHATAITEVANKAATALVSCTANTAATKLLAVSGAEATAHTGCAAGYFYTPMVTTSGSEAAGKCEACDSTAMTGVANKAATTHVSCTSTAANTKRLTVTATGQEATAQNGCASGYFYTPMVTTSGSEASGKCEACVKTTIANLGGHISCTSASSALTISSSVTTNCGIPPATSTAHNAVLSLSAAAFVVMASQF